MVGNEQPHVWRDKFFPPTPEYLLVWIHRRPVSPRLCLSRADLENGQEWVQQEVLICVCIYTCKTEYLLSKMKSHTHILDNLFKFFLMFIYFWDRERQSVSGGGAERERHTHRIRSRLQARSCQHRAWRGAQTHGPRDHDLSWSWTLNQLSHPGAPKE